jgi:hypothetical protein
MVFIYLPEYVSSLVDPALGFSREETLFVLRIMNYRLLSMLLYIQNIKTDREEKLLRTHSLYASMRNPGTHVLLCASASIIYATVRYIERHCGKEKFTS